MEEIIPPSPPNSMLRHPKWQQVGVTKSIYFNIEFRGAGGIFSNTVFNVCLIYTSWNFWAGYLSLSWGTMGCLGGGIISSIYGLLLGLDEPPPCIILGDHLTQKSI